MITQPLSIHRFSVSSKPVIDQRAGHTPAVVSAPKRCIMAALPSLTVSTLMP